MDITATELKNRLGRYLDASESNPVVIKKSGRIKSVLISHQLYEKFLALEDAYWANLAKKAEAEGYVGEDATEEILNRMG
jgi:prevent-host-death family protein